MTNMKISLILFTVFTASSFAASEVLPFRGIYQPAPRQADQRDADAILTNMVGFGNVNFGGWTDDYFLEMYVPPADGYTTSIDFLFSDLPQVTGGSLSVWVYEANYPWPEINSEAIADARHDANLGYYDESSGFEHVGDNWVKKGINVVEGADPNYNYDPLGKQIWPASGSGSLAVEPNANDYGWINFPLNDEYGPDNFSFQRDVPFIVVVKILGFPNEGDGADYRMGFRSEVRYMNPRHGMKFYNTNSSPNGRMDENDWGWYIRSYVWDWNINATLTGDRGPVIDMEELYTTLSTSARTVSAIITDDNPSGGAAGVVSVSLFYSVDGGIPVEVVMLATGNPDEYAGIISGQYPGAKITYFVKATDVSGITSAGEPVAYSIFEATEPILFVYDDDALSSGIAAYYYNVTLSDTFFNHFEVWEAKFGPVSYELVANYEIIYHVMGGGPYNETGTYGKVYSAWLAAGTDYIPHRLLMCGQDFLKYPWDGIFQPGDFEYDYLGIESVIPDVNYDGTPESYTRPYAIDAVTDDETTGFLKSYAGDSLQMFYEPAYEVGFNNWIDNLVPTESAIVTITDPNNDNAAVAVRNSGSFWKTAFWAIDALSINYYSPMDTSSMYKWALTKVGNPTLETFEWFGPPHFGCWHWWPPPDPDTTTSVDSELPFETALKYSYPNPFNPITTIRYELGEQLDVSLQISDVRGRLVRTLVDQSRSAGSYTTQWNGLDQQGRQVSTGVYYARLKAGDYSRVIKMVLLR